MSSASLGSVCRLLVQNKAWNNNKELKRQSSHSYPATGDDVIFICLFVEQLFALFCDFIPYQIYLLMVKQQNYKENWAILTLKTDFHC